MNSVLLRSALVLSVAATVAFFRASGWPLGIPGEWTWLRIPAGPEDRFDLALGCLVAAIGAASYLCVAWLGARRMPHARRPEIAAWLYGLTLAGFAWLFFAQESPVDGYRMSKSAFVLYYESSSGYFTKARDHVQDVPSFLARYEQVIEGEVLHIGTHPPGLILAHRGLIELCREFPALTNVLLATQPASVESAFDEIHRNAVQSVPPRPLRDSDRAALWLAALLTQFVGVATVVPIYLVARRTASPSTAWMAATFWPLVPSLAVFLPKSDALYPALGMLFLWLWLEGWRRRSVLMAACSGLVLWLGMFCSLAFVPVVALAALLTGWESWFEAREEPGTRPLAKLGLACAMAGAAFLALVGVLWAAFDLNLLRVWTMNYQNHAAFYDDFTRTWWKWVLVNPLEAAFAVGLPVVIVAVAAYRRALSPEARWARAAGPYWCCAAVWGLLWLSGKNSGEAARLWLVLFPWPVWLATEAFANAEAEDGRLRRFWLFAVILQAAACIATVMRVYGFPQ